MNVEIDIDEAMSRVSALLVGEGVDTSGRPLGLIRKALESFAPDPEPTGVGAVVRSGTGVVYVRNPASTEDGRYWGSRPVAEPRFWDDIPKPVTVLSEGVEL